MKTRSATRFWIAVAGLASALLGCGGDPDRMIAEGRSEESIEARLARQLPSDRFLSRYRLAQAYFLQARRALQAGDSARSDHFLAQARTQSLRILEAMPADAFSHNMLGLVAAYRKDPDAAFDPREPVVYLNLAEIEVYRGELAHARQDLETARRLRAAPALIDLVAALALWKEGNLSAAREQFHGAAARDPKTVRTWGGATSIQTFEDFTGHCCQHGSLCAEYMSSACEQLPQP
jgi:tetratricopeptide (TPR) repeat protein